MANHAYLSASASHRWLACPPSAKLCAQAGDQTSEYAIQGSCAHELAQYQVEKALGRECQDPTENLTYYDAEMLEASVTAIRIVSLTLIGTSLFMLETSYYLYIDYIV